jgi:hypothetical protein
LTPEENGRDENVFIVLIPWVISFLQNKNGFLKNFSILFNLTFDNSD